VFCFFFPMVRAGASRHMPQAGESPSADHSSSPMGVRGPPSLAPGGRRVIV